MPKFENGHPGGPGRPRGSRNIVNQRLDELAAAGADAMVQKVVDAASNGDLAAARLVLSRIWSAPREHPSVRRHIGTVLGSSTAVWQQLKPVMTPTPTSTRSSSRYSPQTQQRRSLTARTNLFWSKTRKSGSPSKRATNQGMG